jgi:hypothetical protein
MYFPEGETPTNLPWYKVGIGITSSFGYSIPTSITIPFRRRSIIFFCNITSSTRPVVITPEEEGVEVEVKVEVEEVEEVEEVVENGIVVKAEVGGKKEDESQF